MYRFLEEEAKRQANIEEITRKSLPLLEETSSPQEVEDDWITDFFDKCRIVSAEDMQRRFGRGGTEQCPPFGQGPHRWQSHYCRLSAEA
jgi:hypothetical protein